MEILAFYFINNPPQARYLVESLTLWPAIRLITRSRYNHVAILCQQGPELVLIEALGKGVTKTGWADWNARAVRRVDRVEWRGDGAALAAMIGRPYDRKTLVLLKAAKMLTGRWFGPTGEEASKAVTCSELGALVVSHPHPWDVSPQELYDYLTSKQVPA